jgi:membrane-associated protease RseP (regulator of RpoE activity)
MAWGFHLGQPKARLGTQVSTMTSELRTFFGAPEDAGLLVQHIEPGSAAEAAKVKVGDVLVEVDGQRIVNVSDVRDALADRSKGDVVDVVVVRSKKRKTLKATLTTEAGPTAFSIPPGFEHGFELPPEARRFMTPEAQAELERELDQVREQLREVERELGELGGPGTPAPPEAPKAKHKRKLKPPKRQGPQ